ncbi:hypothetical protein MOBT1_001183 [Malassezia obtusa]|uniref:Uncharacterized protein n=1 Tax=Malassezia obtusa TaxID=76774 RepID=A0AAF0E002_9BASI|nr:hypothetical protein MOBT1_001183 [Malassezia obtusa]
MKGQFSMSLKDAQQFLRARQSKPDAFDGMAHAMDVMSLDQTMASIPANPLTFIEKLIYTAEREIASWLHQTVHLHGEHGSTCREVLTRPASSVRNTVAILESPPVTDIEYTSTEEFTESDRGDTVSDVDF